MTCAWYDTVRSLKKLLSSLSAKAEDQSDIPAEKAFELWEHKALEIREAGGCIYLIGNGASASMASHFAADLEKNAGINAVVFTDLALMTATSNDISYEEVFSFHLGRKMKTGDMLVAISSSGASPNILRACRVAAEKGGYIATLSAMEADNPLRRMGRLNFYLPAATYGMAESCHAIVLHHWVDRLVVQA